MLYSGLWTICSSLAMRAPLASCGDCSPCQCVRYVCTALALRFLLCLCVRCGCAATVRVFNPIVYVRACFVPRRASVQSRMASMTRESLADGKDASARVSFLTRSVAVSVWGRTRVVLSTALWGLGTAAQT